MDVLAVFGVIGGTVCGTSIVELSEDFNFDSHSPKGFVGAYEDNPHAWWSHFGLEYYFIQQGNYIDEIVGLSLENCLENYFDHTFEDIRGMVHTRLNKAGVEIDYEKIEWSTICALQGG